MKYRGIGVEEAARGAIHDTLTKAGGSGGLIAMDAKGSFVAEHNSPGLAHGFIDASGKVTIGFRADSRE
jgi:beta-aspartyl-peptidase (threonine type)